MLQMMELPLPYDKLNNDISEFDEENIIQKNTNLSMTLSTFLILIYRYCMNVYFPLVIYEQEKLKIYSIPSSTSKASEIIRIVDMILQNKIECEKEENYNKTIF